MNRYPVIGISCRFAVDEAWCPPLIGIRQGYVNAVVDAGGIPLLIPPQALDERRLRQVYQSLDGVLLPGGVDVAPELYGEQPHRSLAPSSRCATAPSCSWRAGRCKTTSRCWRSAADCRC